MSLNLLSWYTLDSWLYVPGDAYGIWVWGRGGYIVRVWRNGVLYTPREVCASTLVPCL